MPEKSGMFDSTADDPREYAARDFAEYFGRLLTNGVFNAGQYLNVSATGQDANVSLSPGAAWINGYAYSVYDAAIRLPIQPAAAQDRIDRVILRLDTSAPVRAIKAIVLQGLPGATPNPPALVRSGNIYDISLAQIKIKANTSIVLPANITDERLDNSVCGLVNSLIKVDTTIFQQQWDAYMATLQSAGYVTGATFNAHLADSTSHVYYSDDTGTANAKVVAITPVPTVYKKGLGIAFTNLVQNTGAVTINVNGLGAKSILKSNGNALVSGNLKASSIYTLRYNGTSFILQGEGGGGNAKPADVLSGLTFTNDDGEQIGSLIPGMKSATGKLVAGKTGTISNLTFKPIIFLVVAYTTVFGNMYGGSSGSAYANGSANGLILAYKLTDSSSVVYKPLNIAIYDNYGARYTNENSLSSVTFGVNNINYTLAADAGTADYYIFGT